MWQGYPKKAARRILKTMMVAVCLLLAPAVGLAAVPATADLCAPCHTPDECRGGLCVQPSDPNFPAYCSQACNVQTPCPTKFNCATDPNGVSFCEPTSNPICAQFYHGVPLQEICSFPAGTTTDSVGLIRNCLPNESCVTLVSGFGGCVPACSSTDPSKTCPSGQDCCFGSSGSCQPSAPNLNAVGGCFEHMQIGDRCGLPSQTFCPSGSLCTEPPGSADPSRAFCFRLCDDNTPCYTGETCITTSGNPQGQCCQVNSLDSNNLTSCRPQPACILDLGAACSLSTDCRSQLCQHRGSQTACSQPCSGAGDCPTASSCTDIGGRSFCWPNQAPTAAPICPVPLPPSNGHCSGLSDQVLNVTGASSCGSNGNNRSSCGQLGGAQAWIGSLLLLGWRRRRRP